MRSTSSRGRPAGRAGADRGSDAAAHDPRAVPVGATEYASTRSQRQVQAGDVRVQLDSAEGSHDLLVGRGDEVVAAFGEQPPGAIAVQRVRLDAGTHRLICPLPRHEEWGMHAEMRGVTGGT